VPRNKNAANAALEIRTVARNRTWDLPGWYLDRLFAVVPLVAQLPELPDGEVVCRYGRIVGVITRDNDDWLVQEV
jgi:hypothetical protein